MDETPEELAQIRREADEIDVHQYRRRFRTIKAILLGAALAGLTWLVLFMVESKRNPCERVRNYFCKADPVSPQCANYDVLLRETLDEHGEAKEMRANIRAQCQTKIETLRADQGIQIR